MTQRLGLKVNYPVSFREYASLWLVHLAEDDTLNRHATDIVGARGDSIVSPERTVYTQDLAPVPTSALSRRSHSSPVIGKRKFLLYPHSRV